METGSGFIGHAADPLVCNQHACVVTRRGAHACFCNILGNACPIFYQTEIIWLNENYFKSKSDTYMNNIIFNCDKVNQKSWDLGDIFHTIVFLKIVNYPYSTEWISDPCLG